MIEKIKQNWKKLTGLTGVLLLFVVPILTLDDFIGSIEKRLKQLSETALHDYVRHEPEGGKARVLVADIRHDENGRYTAEIREMLRRDGKRYRMLEREYGEEDEEGNWEDLEQLLERHKSVILLEGSVSANGETIRIRARNRDGSIDKRAEIELNGSSSWDREIKQYDRRGNTGISRQCSGRAICS